MKPDKDKIDYLNSNTHHLVKNFKAEDGKCIEVMVKLTPNVEDTLLELGMSETWIDVNRVETDNGYEIDISEVGFKRTGAKWWDEEHGFMSYRYE